MHHELASQAVSCYNRGVNNVLPERCYQHPQAWTNLFRRLVVDILSSNAPKGKDRTEYFRQWRDQVITKICAECNTPYQTRRGNGGDKPTYCDDCKIIRRKRFRPQTFLICQNCNQEFGPVERLDVKYCSRKCKNEALKDKPNAKRGRKYPHTQRAAIHVCPSCGTEFRGVADTKRRSQIYCSHACYLKERRVSYFENRVMDLVESKGIPLERQVKRGKWSFDAAIANTSILIEADGAYWHSLEKAKERDARKNQWCLEHGYTLIRISELEFYRDPLEAINVILTRWETLTGETAELLERVEEVAHA